MTEVFGFDSKTRCSSCEEVGDCVTIYSMVEANSTLCSSCLQRAHAFLLKAVAEKLTHD